MQEKAKVSLSALEYQLVTDESFILTKNGIIQKVYSLFGRLIDDYNAYLQPQLLQVASPKISKGENYKGLPYVMMDHPRIFSTNDVLAIRSFFWWGKYFSCTLHVKGSFQQEYQERIKQAIDQEPFHPLLISDGADEWNHDIEQGYTSVQNMNAASWKNLPFLKLVNVHPLQQWETAAAFFSTTCAMYAALLQD